MIRALSIIGITGVALAALVGAPSRLNRVAACSIAPSMFEDGVRRAELIVLANVVDVGGPENSAPTLTPTVTPPPPDTPTRDPSATRTPKATRSATAAARTESPTPAYVTPTPPGLLGQRATLDVVESYVGTPEPRFVLDVSARAAYERELRAGDARRGGSCGPSPAARYVAGGQYVVFAASSVQGDLRTTQRLRVEGGDVRLSEDIYGTVHHYGLQMRGETYRRYFADVEARIEQGTDYDYATITADRLPLSMLVRAIAGIRSGTLIVPPDTGSAGLAATNR